MVPEVIPVDVEETEAPTEMDEATAEDDTATFVEPAAAATVVVIS